MEPFGRRIAKQRAELGWTQARLAERVAISRVALSHLEAGLSVANERTVALLAGAFGLEAHELVDGTDYPPAKRDRLPLVVARHTEVDLHLARLAGDLAWLDPLLPRTDGGTGPVEDGRAGSADAGWWQLGFAALARWTDELAALAATTVDPHERSRVEAARRQVSTVSAALRTARAQPAAARRR